MHCDEGQGPREMLMSFVAQLLLQQVTGLDFSELLWEKEQRAKGNVNHIFDQGHYYDEYYDYYGDEEKEAVAAAFSYWDAMELCDLIDFAMRQLAGRTTIFFVIDSIELFKQQRARGDEDPLQDFFDAMACLSGSRASTRGSRLQPLKEKKTTKERKIVCRYIVKEPWRIMGYLNI